MSFNCTYFSNNGLYQRKLVRLVTLKEKCPSLRAVLEMYYLLHQARVQNNLSEFLDSVRFKVLVSVLDLEPFTENLSWSWLEGFVDRAIVAHYEKNFVIV